MYRATNSAYDLKSNSTVVLETRCGLTAKEALRLAKFNWKIVRESDGARCEIMGKGTRSAKIVALTAEQCAKLDATLERIANAQPVKIAAGEELPAEDFGDYSEHE